MNNVNNSRNRFIRFFTEEKLSQHSWMIDDEVKFMKARFIKALFAFILMSCISAISLFVFDYFSIIHINFLLCLFPVFLVTYIAFKWDFWLLNSKFKKMKGDVYKAFPLWVSTLEILVMTNNIPNTFKKSISTCPDAFKQDLIDFVDNIQEDQENKQHYRNFLSRYDIPEVNEIIMDMYAFNQLDKKEIIYEFKSLNERLNKITARIRQERQSLSMFAISALNSIPLFIVSIYVLLISMLINVAE